MDILFYVIAGVLALILFYVIARNLIALDRRDRPMLHAPPPEETTAAEPPEPPRPSEEAKAAPPPAAPAPQPASPPATAPAPAPGGPMRGIPEDLVRKEQEEADENYGEPIPLMRERTPEPVGKQVEFSAYYPKEIAPGEWYKLAAYMFRAQAAGAVSADVKTVLGEQLRDYRAVTESGKQEVADGTLVTATPHLDGVVFNPPSISLGLFEEWHRFDFRLKADSAPVGLAANGQITFTVEGVIVADVPLSIFVGEQAAEAEAATITAKPYLAVFCSYSRKDMEIVKRVERAYRALGFDYLRDLLSIRSGEAWDEALENLIERADIFQLFWSTNSASSPYVQAEWEYALQLQATRPNFIRPVFWDQPMPPPPEALSHINFAYQPDLDDE